MAKVLCCQATFKSKALGITTPHPRTLASLDLAREAGYDVEVVDVTGKPYGYWESVRDRWTGDLIIVEHDIGFTVDQLASLAECPEPWCLFGYKSPGPGVEILMGRKPTSRVVDVYDKSIGFVKFSASVTEAMPVGDILPKEEEAVHWSRMDDNLFRALMTAGFKQHLHDGLVEHYHWGESNTPF